MTNLSPAAQAVDDAFWKTVNDKWNIYDRRRCQLAAALRAVVDQVIPPKQETPWGSVIQATSVELRIRSQLLGIAAELEALPND